MRDTGHNKNIIYTLVLLLFFTTNVAYAAIQKSPTDQRDYLAFTLPNEMKVLVISDPSTDKAAASVNIGVGSNANPDNRLGLAHFLEHMLFLGTEKYPEAGSYQEYISNHGGTHNAFTAFENTNYFFDIKADELEPALDRFSHFFIDPLFAEKYVDRERHAVNSEYQSKLRDDGRRGYSAGKHLINPQHSMSRFAVGSLKTLSNDHGKLREDLIDFYHRYYSTNLMSLVVLGKAPVAELKKLVEAKFSPVENRHATPFITAVPLYLHLPQQQNIKTLKDLQQLTLTFPIQATREYYREKPAHYIASMLGYEGKGSLFSALKSKGWVNSLSAYRGTDLPDQSSIELSISLTDEGLKNYNEVIETTFAAIQLLKQQGVSAELYQEEQQLSEISFRFKEQSEPIHEVTRLSHNLQLYPADAVISADYLMEKFDPALIENILQQMTPDNLLITLQAKSVQTDQQDPWFKAEYSVNPIDTDRLKKWRQPEAVAALQIRQLNPYIADNFALKPIEHEQQHPEKILQEGGFSLWHKQDNIFKLPKADFFFSIISPQANQTAENAVMTSLYTKLINDQLNETLYDASLAGLNTRIYPHMRGLSVRISGYNDKQQKLLKQVITSLQHAQFNESNFARIKEKYTQELENSRKDKPFNQAIGEVYNLLLQSWSTDKKLAALDSLTLEKLHTFVPQLLSQVEVRMLAHGNLTPAEALQMAQTVEAGLPSEKTLHNSNALPVILLQENTELTQTLPLDHNDSAISVYFQGESSNTQTRAEYALLGEMLSAPFYSSLRTEQQLGYVVFETALPMRKAPGLAFVVQSPNTNPLGLEQQINKFIDSMETTLTAMDEQQLNAFKQSLISRINRKENRMGELSERYWQEIDRGDLNFDSREQLTHAIEALTLEDLHKCYAQLPLRRLTVRSFGEQHRQGVEKQDLQKICDSEIAKLKQADQFVPDA
ncbi:insulinase family protein [Amphritea sp. 2_MG-2023]|uniref:insulinase family protein n=1 Tax=Amphritea TaxID=515417 RepID=UPI001C064F76|nr:MULTISPECIES: insulinase family protein [Amphritea]MBU2965420.1 insulinase family protein [Amphritea atlantica]MDO6420710.1 insulinase family protein [Amphritea sp. 2_MG-2023]